jgi:hypothetical protein
VTIQKSQIKRVGIEISGSGATSWTSPIIVYVDSISTNTTSPAALAQPFAATASVSTTPGATDQANQVLWNNNNSSYDTIGTTPTLEWVATCP